MSIRWKDEGLSHFPGKQLIFQAPWSCRLTYKLGFLQDELRWSSFPAFLPRLGVTAHRNGPACSILAQTGFRKTAHVIFRATCQSCVLTRWRAADSPCWQAVGWSCSLGEKNETAPAVGSGLQRYLFAAATRQSCMNLSSSLHRHGPAPLPLSMSLAREDGLRAPAGGKIW